MSRGAPGRCRSPAPRAAGALSALVVLAAASVGCDAPGDARVLVALPAFGNELPLRAPRATLSVLDPEGRAGAVELTEPPEGVPRILQSPVPVPCDADGVCSLGVRLSPGTWRFVMQLWAQDRCGAEGEVLRFASYDVEVSSWGTASVDLELERADFDLDGDGVPAWFELGTCGRLDVVDGAAAPAACLDAADPCCASPSPLEGRRAAFAGGEHTRADGSSVTVAPFALDATEATWRQLARCVAARACLVDQPGHPLRLALEGAAPAEPLRGLTPAEGEELCAFYGARLPLDDEWDFAAAHRSDGTRGRYPWDGDDTGALVGLLDEAPARAASGDDREVGCDPSDPGVSANHQRRQAPCAGVPLPVGSFPTSHLRRGAGAPLADVGGNVAEWTRVPGGSLDIPELPPGTAAAVLRGGGAASVIELLENDIPVVTRAPGDGDAEAWSATVRRLSTEAGVRCARSVDDGTVAPSFVAEPRCGP